MADALGYRKKFAVVAPSTNTVVQPEFDRMAPHGVTNHCSRIHIPDDPLGSDADFDELCRKAPDNWYIPCEQAEELGLIAGIV